MSEPRHATVWTKPPPWQEVERLHGGFWIRSAYVPKRLGDEPFVDCWLNVQTQEVERMTEKNRDMWRFIDAALEGVKPFPFSLPGVPDEVLR